jgi:hypothetical protein
LMFLVFFHLDSRSMFLKRLSRLVYPEFLQM